MPSLSSLRRGLIAWAITVSFFAPAFAGQSSATQPPTTQPEVANIRFQFDNAPFDKVIEQFAQASGKPLIASGHVDGTLTFFDSKPYTFDQALDTLNLMLAMRGYTLMEDGRYLRLVKLDQINQMPIKILHGMANTKGIRPGQIVTVVLPLQYIDAQSTAKLVTPMVSTFGSVAPLNSGKGIVVTDRLSNIQRIRSLINDLDTGNLSSEQIQSYHLKYASADDAAKIIQKLFGGKQSLVVRLGDQGAQAGANPQLLRHLRRMQKSRSAEQSLTVSVDDRTNTLFMRGPVDRLTLARQVLEQIDQAKPTANGDFQLFQLQNAQAQSIATTLQQAFGQSPRGRHRGQKPGQSTPVRIVAEDSTNQLLVSASQETMEQIASLIQQLDSAASSKGGFKVIHLQNANASDLADIIRRTVTARGRGRGKRNSAINVSADTRSNSLVLAGSAAALTTAESIVHTLDSSQKGQLREIHVVSLTQGDAVELARSISRLFAARGGHAGRHGQSSHLNVVGDRSTNTLMISVTPGDWPQVQSILKQLAITGNAPQTPVTRVVPLTHANATQLAGALDRIYHAQSHSRHSHQPASVVIAAMTRTNSLLISAPRQAQEEIASLIKTLDVPVGGKSTGIQVIHLTTANANQLAASLRHMLPGAGRAGTVSIEADQATNSVLLRAPADQQKQLEQLIEKLDKPIQASATETRIIVLKGGSAASMATTLNQLYAGHGRGHGRSSTADPMSQLRIAAAPGDHALVVAGPHAAVQQIAAVAASLDTQSVPGQMQIRAYQIQNAQASDIADSLAKLFTQQQQGRRGHHSQNQTAANQPQPRFTAVSSTNQLLVSATENEFPKIELLIKKLQTTPTVTSQMRTFQLKYASAQQISSMLQTMLGSQKSSTPSWAWWLPKKNKSQTTRIAALSGENAVVVQGTPDQLSVAGQLIKTFDTPKAAQWQRIQVVQLQKADAATLAKSISQSLQNRASRRGRSNNAQPVTVTAETNSNSLLVRGPANQVPDVITMIKQLDKDASSDAVQVRVYPLKQGDAKTMAKSLSTLFTNLQRQQRRARGGSQSQPAPFAVTVDTRTNSLVVSTTESQFTVVEHLIKTLQQTPVQPSRDVQYVWLKHADASSVAGKLADMFVGRKLSDQPVIDVNGNSNSLTIIASRADMQTMRPVIEKLDHSAGDTTIHVRVIPLDQTRAQTMADILRRVYRQLGRGPVTIHTASDNSAAAAPPATQPIGASASGPMPVTITVDPNANALIVAATSEDLDHITSLISELSASADQGAPDFRVFHLKQADPAAVAQTLDSLFNNKQSQAPQRPQRRGKHGQRSAPQPAKPTISVVADPATRSVVVRATPQDFDVIQGLIQQLDSATASNSEIRVFTLQHAQANEVAQNLQSLFSQAPPNAHLSRGQRRSPEQSRAAAVRQDLMMIEKTGEKLQVSSTGPIEVTANNTSNAVVVTAPQPVMALVQQVIQELDQSAAASDAAVVRMYHLDHADAESTVTRLDALFGQVRARRSRRGSAPIPTRITADPASNLLIVSAAANQQSVIAKIISDLDTAQAGHTTTVQVIHLKDADAQSVAAALLHTLAAQSSAGRRGRGNAGSSGAAIEISADRSSNSIVIRADDQTQQRVAKLVSQLDAAPGSQLPLHLITLKNADASDIATLLGQVFNSAGPGNHRGRGTNQHQDIVIKPDPSAGMILVRADDDTFNRIQSMAQQLDQASTAAATSVHVIALKNSDAPTTAAAIENLYTQQLKAARREHRTIAPLAVTADARANAVVVVTSQTIYKQVSDWVDQLEKMKPGRGSVHVITLAHADPDSVNQAIEQLFNQPSAGSNARGHRGRGVSQTSVAGVQTTVLPDQRSILVSANDDDFKQIKKLVATLDAAAATAGPKVKVFSLKHASNQQVAAALTRLYNAARHGRGRQSSSANQVQVQALRQSNAVVVTASASDMQQVAQLIAQLDNKNVSPDVSFHIYPLKNATPSKILEVLNRLLIPVRAANSGEPIVAQADDRTRSIIVSATNPQIFIQVGKVIDKLDQAPAYADAQVSIIALKQADAGQVAKVLEAMLEPATKNKVSPEAAALQEQVRRLKIAAGSGASHALLTLDLTKPIKITPDPLTGNQQGSNQLLISSTPDNVKALTAVVNMLDRVPAAPGMRIYPLKEADATQLQKTLSGLFKQSSKNHKAPQPSIVADARTNSLIVSADKQSLATVTTLVDRLDVKQPIDLRDMHLLTLQNADAATLATTIQKMMDARVQRETSLGVADAAALKTLITADPRSNSLIVGGSKDSFELVKQLATSLDSAAPALGGQIQLFPLRQANAGTLATTLTNLFNQRYQAARTQQVKRQKPVILPDVRTNSLLVAADTDDSKVITSLLAKLDVKLTNPSVSLKVIPLENNDAGAVGPMVQKLFAARLKSMTPQGQQPSPQDQVDVGVDALSNALVISASKENQQLIASLVQKLDVQPTATNGLVQMFHLQHADATQVASMLKQLVSQGLYKPATMAAGQNAIVKQREKVSITADARTNVLIVSASKDNLTILGQIIKTLDSTADYAGLGDVRVYALKHADATQLAPTLQQFFKSKEAAENSVGAGGKALPVTVLPDPRTNTLLVAGGKGAFSSISAMIKKLDVQDVSPAGQFSIFYLKRATAATVAPMIRQLFANRVTRGKTKTAVTVVSDTQANALFVGASDADMALVKSFIQRLDQMPAKNGSVRAFTLEKANADQVAKTLQQLFNQNNAAGNQTGGSGPSGVAISVDDRLNTIVVSGGAVDLDRVAKLVKQLDATAGAKVTALRIFPLKNADATELANILTETLTKRPVTLPGVNPNRQALLQFVTRTPRGQKLMTSALQSGVLIVPDVRTNTLVVSAPQDEMPLLTNLIQALDSTTPPEAQIKVFHLVNADAGQMASVLRNLFRLPSSGNASAASQQLTGREVAYKMNSSGQDLASSSKQDNPSDGKKSDGSDPPGDPAQATLGSAAEYALTVTVDPRTNSVLIGGTQHYVDLAASIIKELDSSPAQQRITRVYRLRNAQATDIATAINSFIQQQRQNLVQTLGQNRLGAAQRLLDDQVAIVPEKTTNTLLISASPRYFQTIASMIKQLDQPPPQVLIQVLLAEVTLNNQLDLGMEWNYKFGVKGEQASVGTAFGVAQDLASMGGFNFSVTGGKLTLLLRAMASQGRLKVLSRPQILASDNQPASINVGQRVPFITNTNVSNNGSVFNTIHYQNVGIILNVTPRITQDGAVKMDVAPEISSLSTSTVSLGNGINAAVINNRSAQTTVTVQDGHTIVIGGLITTQDNDTEKKVPLLGDIPFLGSLFRSESHTKQRTELLIIMTPHVLQGVKDADSLTNNQINRLDLLSSQVGHKAFTRGMPNLLLNATQPTHSTEGNSQNDPANQPNQQPGNTPDQRPDKPKAAPSETPTVKTPKDIIY